MRSLAALIILTFSVCGVRAATFDMGLLNGYPAVRISGSIDMGDDQAFMDLMRDKSSSTFIVELNSGGGKVAPALAIGTFIHDHKAWTLVGDNEACASACAMIWLGGYRRFWGMQGSLGFHAAFNTVGNQNFVAGDGNALVGAYYARLGLKDAAVAWMASAPPEGMNWLHADTARQLGIDYTVANPGDHIVVSETHVASIGVPHNPNATPGVAWNKPDGGVQNLGPARAVPEASPEYVAPHQPRPVVLNPSEQASAMRLARQFQKRLDEAGPEALVVSIRACYDSVRQSIDGNAAEYCSALDEMTWKLDMKAALENGTQPSTFSQEANVRARIKSAASVTGYDPDVLLDDATQIAKEAQVIVDGEGGARVVASDPAPVTRRRPKVVRPRFVAGCTPSNSVAALLFGVTPNPACQ